MDLATGRRNRVPVAQLIRRTLRDIEPHARELGSERELEGVRDILARGNGADRQRRTFNANRDIVEVVREIAATASSSRPRIETSSSASRARGPLESSSARSAQRLRKTIAGRNAITLAANEAQRWPPIAVRLSRTAAPRIAAGMPMQGKTSASASSFAVRRERSRQKPGASAAVTPRYAIATANSGTALKRTALLSALTGLWG